MARCDVCGNDYDQAFEVHAGGAVHTFDSFVCCASCATTAGVSGVRDHV